jgi:hypothetical protein
MQFKYIRLFADSSGESHFEDITSELLPIEFVPSAPPLHLTQLSPAKSIGFFGAEADWNSNWHISSARNLFVLISGSWEIEASDGQKRTLSSGDILLVEDTTGQGHRSRVSGDQESLAVLIELQNQ